MKRVAVIGAGIGGLTAAGLLRAQGHEVTVFEKLPTVGGKAQVFSAQGVTLDTGPTVMTMPETVRATFAALKATDLLPQLTAIPLQTHYRWPDGAELSCWDEVEKTAAEAERLAPGEGRALQAFYAEAERIFAAAGPPYLSQPYDSMAGFLMRAARNGLSTLLTGATLSTLDGLARRHFATAHLRQFAGRFATYTGASPYRASAAFAMIAHLERAFGVHHVQGGVGALVNALHRAVARLGVEVVLDAEAHWAAVGGRHEVRTGAGARTFDAVVVNRDPLESLRRTDEPLTMSGFVLFLKAPRVALPHHTILFAPDARAEFDALERGELHPEPTLHLCHPAATDASMAPPDASGLYVMANVPAFRGQDFEATWQAQGDLLEARVLSRLRALVPQLEATPLTVLGRRTPFDLARTGAPGGSIYGFLPHGRFGPFRRPPQRGPWPGVFFAGGGTHPGGGVPMVMLSGRFAASLAQRHLEAA